MREGRRLPRKSLGAPGLPQRSLENRVQRLGMRIVCLRLGSLPKQQLRFFPAVCLSVVNARNRGLLPGNLQELFGAGQAMRHRCRPVRRLALLRRLSFGPDLQRFRPVRFFVRAGNMFVAGQTVRCLERQLRRHVKLRHLLLGPDLQRFRPVRRFLHAGNLRVAGQTVRCLERQLRRHGELRFLPGRRILHCLRPVRRR